MENKGASSEDAHNLMMECMGDELAEAVKGVELAAKGIPLEEDFHFYSNFSEFKLPLQSIRARAEALLAHLGSCAHLRSQPPLAWPPDADDAYEWLVALQDDLLEKLDSALDEARTESGGGDKREGSWELDYEMTVVRKRRKHCVRRDGEGKGGKGDEIRVRKEVRIAQKVRKVKERMPVPFHVKHIPRPQERFDVMVDNSNTPFRHPPPSLVVRHLRDVDGSCERVIAGRDDESSMLHSDEGSLGLSSAKAVHPLEDIISNLECSNNMLDDHEPQKPRSIRETPCTLIESPSALENMASKLRAAKEIAVDLENHHYRSFQGFVCLMQISTRNEDFLVDTLTLRGQIGTCLRDIFANPSICKVMHGADCDVLWLQRDFGIYLCNLFDTGQAARVLDFPSSGLAFLLQEFCGVHVDKRYQIADWRIRPLPSEMQRYAREDTHYLLYAYDILKRKLISNESSLSGSNLYVEVFRRSQAICLQLYRKELLNEVSHMRLYESSQRKLQLDQLSVFAALYAWRDQVARDEDESIGYVLPNHLLFHLAEEMPTSMQKLQAIIKDRQSLVGQHATNVLDIIRHAKATTTVPKVMQHSWSPQHAKPPENIKEGAICSLENTPKSTSDEIGCSEDKLNNADSIAEEMPPSSKYLMGGGDCTSAVCKMEKKAVVPSAESREADSKEGDSNQGQHSMPLKADSGNVIVSRTNASALFRRSSGKGKPLFASSTFSQGSAFPCTSTEASLTINTALENQIETNPRFLLDTVDQERESKDDIVVPLIDSQHKEDLIRKNPASFAYHETRCENPSESVRQSSWVSQVTNTNEVQKYDAEISRATFPSVPDVRNVDRQVTVPTLGRPYNRPSGGLGKMLGVFGRSHHYSSFSEDTEELEAKKKAEQIRASVCLSFHTFTGPAAGHIQKKTENEGACFNDALKVRSATENEPTCPNVLVPVSVQSNADVKVDEFISLENIEANATDEALVQANSHEVKCLSNRLGCAEFDGNHNGSMKHTSWWPRVKTGNQIHLDF